MLLSAQMLLDRKSRATSDGRKNPGNSVLPAHTPLARTPGPRARRRHGSPVDSSPVLLHRGPGNANSGEPDQRRQGYCSHTHVSVLLPWKRLEQVVPLESCLSPFLVESSSQTFYSVKTCQEVSMLPGGERCPDSRGLSMGGGTILSLVCATRSKA